MDFHEEDPDLAEAIRLSLAESQLRSSQSARPSPSSLPAERPLPLVIDLTDDMEPVKVEPSTETIEHLHGPRIGTFERQGPRIGTFEPQGPRMGTFDDTINGNINNNNKEDEDLKKAIALSLVDRPGQKSSPGTSTKRPAPVVEAPTPFDFDQLNRAEMERARQERIKRKATAGNAPPAALQSNGMAKKSRLTSPASDKGMAASSTASTSSASSTPSPSSRPAATSRPQVLPSPSMPTASTAPSTAPTQSPRPATSSASSGSSSVPYPAQYLAATFRNTCIQGRSVGSWDIRFEDLLNKDYLMKAMLTTYQLDEEWLRKYLPKTLPQCIVKNWTGGSKDEPRYQRIGKNVYYVHPPLSGNGGCFHPKLMLLFYPTFCRVVVSSANLVDHDWSEMVNTLYVQDFPFLQAAVEDPDELGEFGSTLYNYLTLMEVPERILFVVKTVDFSSAKVLLVPTVQGTYPVASKFTYGIAQLSKILQTRTSQNEGMEIEYQTSSVGRLSLKFLCEFSRASRGVPVRSRYKTNVEERLPPIKVVFPTERHVQMSRLGEDGAGTVCFQKKFWDEHSFPKRVMHDFECVGAHKGSLMHSKFILAKSSVPLSSIDGRPLVMPGTSRNVNQPRETGCAGWIYVGSANLSESAWGTIANKKDAITSQHGLVVSMRNWELGVVYIIETEEDMRAMTEIAQASGLDRASDGSIQSFFGPLPVPYKRPLRPYDVNDRPWCFF